MRGLELRTELVRLHEKHGQAAQGADHAFHEAALLDGLTVTGKPFVPRALRGSDGAHTRKPRRVWRAARHERTPHRLGPARRRPAFDGAGLYLVDSFEGLSAMHPADAVAENRYSMKQGDFATPFEHVRGVMAAFPGCKAVKGWIPGALEYFLPRLAAGAVVVNDDYASPRFPGAGQAWDECLGRRRLPFVVLDSGQAVFVNRG